MYGNTFLICVQFVVCNYEYLITETLKSWYNIVYFYKMRCLIIIYSEATEVKTTGNKKMKQHINQNEEQSINWIYNKKENRAPRDWLPRWQPAVIGRRGDCVQKLDTF